MTQLLPLAHAKPQPAQLLLSLCVFTQVPPAPPHRVGVLVGQQRLNPAFTVPAGQTHVPLWQIRSPGHAAPQPPQLFLSLPCRSVQVPLAPPQRVGVLEGQQRLNPALTVPAGQTHAPLWLTRSPGQFPLTQFPFWQIMPAGHLLPQEAGPLPMPQLFGSLAVFVHTPPQFCTCPLCVQQITWAPGALLVFVVAEVPGGQTQLPFWQIIPAPHLLPQAAEPMPQLFGSLRVSTHAPEQQVRPLEHWTLSVQAPHAPFTQTCPAGHWALVVQTHFPPEQLWPLGHLVPQAPQLLASVWVFVQVPLQLVGVAVGQQTPLAQTWALGSHTGPVALPQWHWPPAQTSPARQALPQVPQLLLSVCRLTQLPPQLLVPPVQLRAQAPFVQT